MEQEKSPIVLRVEDQQSLIHLGSLDSFDITEGGTDAAKAILSYFENGKKKELEKAISIYEEIIPNENFGGEYTALEWMCRFFLAPEQAQKDLLAQPLSKAFYDMLAKDDFDNLKTYLKYKYHIVEYGPGDNIEIKARMRFLEDFILFNNPDRERWESTRENLERFQLKEGMTIADVGSGPGYYSFKFSDIVGDKGKVYAIETNPRHLDFLRDYIADNDVKNVEVVESSFEGIGLSSDVRVDVVYVCSLFHNVYAAFTDGEREEFIGSIRTALGNGGQLIVVDNDLVTGQELPYHGPYISKDLIISQLYYYGFKLKDAFQFTPQRYAMIFDMVDVPESAPEKPELAENEIFVDSNVSLARYRIIGTSTSGYTVRGKKPGRKMYEGIMENDENKLREAYKEFEELWPKERIGDDYTALMWFIEYKLADENKRKEMTQDGLTEMYADFFCGNDFDRLKQYLLYKFHLEKPDPVDASFEASFDYDGDDFSIGTINEWNEYLIFNNPNRKLWEKTDEMCKFFDIKEGEHIADIGCGSGFFTWYFSKKVGDKGKVYATELNKNAIKYVDDLIERYNIKNIKTIVTKMNKSGLSDNSVDTIFMCSMYHAAYITDIEFVKDSFIDTLHKALRKGGRIIIVDNNVTAPGVPSYYGPGISPELLIQQLKYYGFNLVDRFEMIPQRFALILEEDPNYTGPKGGGKDEYGRDKDSKQKSSRGRKRGRRKSEDPMLHEGQEPDMFYDRKKK